MMMSRRTLVCYCVLIGLIACVHIIFKRSPTPLLSTCGIYTKLKNTSSHTDLPQKLTIGKFYNETGAPFITQDFWYNIVDNKRTFFLRPSEQGYPSVLQLRKWVQSRLYPITLVINNQVAKSWPSDIKTIEEHKLLLSEPNLHAVYAGNPRELNETKLKPIPLGPKWNWHHRILFSEPKNDNVKNMIKYFATTPENAQALFESKNRTTTVYIRGMSNSNGGNKYVCDTPALKTKRNNIYSKIKENASQTLVTSFKKIPYNIFLKTLQTHRFVISPAGAGLDTHGTWEALYSGCIPIVPKSPLDPVFEGLPVWLVDSWEEVTDFSVKKKAKEMQHKKYKWEKLFVPFWKKEIYNGLC